MNAVGFDAVSFTYPGAPRPVLSDVSFVIPEGTFVLVTGATGAGKSTLLQAVNGLVPHFSGGVFSGRVTVGGRSTLDAPPRRLAGVVGFVPQDPGASFVLDRVEDELAYAMENLGMPPRVMRRRVEETLDLLGLVDLRDRSVRTLSGGERQRVSIGAVLTAAPRVLVLDEPTSQLDPQAAEDVLAALQRLVHDIGMTVIVAEHRLERVAGFADLAVGVEAAAVVVGTPGEVFAELGSGPPVARVGRLLGWDPLPTTVREARQRRGRMRAPRPVPPPERGRRLVTASGLRAGHGHREVLHNLDVALLAGERVALMGRNASGKTTLLRCLTGVHSPTGGEVDASGRAPRAGIDIALCPQESDGLLFKDSVAAELDATRARGPLTTAVGQTLSDLGISDLAGNHPRDLSAGERLLVAIGAMARTGAPVLLLDEPTRGLDVETKARLTHFLTRRAAQGGATMFATHDVELAAELATRIVVMAAGEVIADGAPADVLGDSPLFAPQMTRVFGPGWLTPEQVAGERVTV